MASKNFEQYKIHLPEEEFCHEFQDIMEAKNIPLPLKVQPPIEKPPWLDDNLILKGQEFAQKYFAAINFGQLIGLCTLFTFTSSLKPLIYTRKSDTPKAASLRYSSTAIIVKSWLEEDLWNPESKGRQNIITVRKLHLNTSNKMNNSHPIEVHRRCTLLYLLPQHEIRASLFPTIQTDFKGFCPVYYEKFAKSNIYFNQTEMSLTVFGFMGVVVYDPEKLGIPSTDIEGLAGFVHLWRVIAYLLGVEDQYNFCRGDLNEVRERCNKTVNRVFLSNMENISYEWEHMSRCVLDGINSIMKVDISFEVLLLYLFWALNWNANNLRQKVGWYSKCKFFIFKSVFSIVYRVSFIRNIVNSRLKYMLKVLEDKGMKH